MGDIFTALFDGIVGIVEKFSFVSGYDNWWLVNIRAGVLKILSFFKF